LQRQDWFAGRQPGRPDDLCFTKDGKQYLLLTVGGARQSPERGDYVIAHALRSR